jgi:hypothetical protein
MEGAAMIQDDAKDGSTGILRTPGLPPATAEEGAKVAEATDEPGTIAVVSCPACLRQYRAPPSAEGKIGRCARCGAHFAIAIAEWRLPEGEPVDFADPVGPRFNFFREGCAAFARNAIDLLKLAGEPVSIARLLSIVVSLPRHPSDLMDERWRLGYCSRTMEAAHNRVGDAERVRYLDLFTYFVEHIPGRDRDALDMLTAAFLGVLGHDELELPPPPPPTPVRRGGLLRWLGKAAFLKRPRR